VLVFFDSSPLAQTPIKQAKATLSPIDRGLTKASVEMTLDRRRMHVTSSIWSRQRYLNGCIRWRSWDRWRDKCHLLASGTVLTKAGTRHHSQSGNAD